MCYGCTTNGEEARAADQGRRLRQLMRLDGEAPDYGRTAEAYRVYAARVPRGPSSEGR